MSTTTLTSLAILKVNVDHNRDYLDYLQPFILQVLLDHKPDPITIRVVSDHIHAQFGLEIPERTVEIVLRRISKQRYLKREHGKYRITGDLPDPQITTKKNEAKRHIDAIIHGLQQFSQDTAKAISDPGDAVVAICAFLAEFDITCLRAYLRGTAIPQLEGSHRIDIVLVSNYIQHLQRTDPERFDSFQVLVQGHMLANALLCPDLHNAPKTYQNVTFYLDTPLLIQRLGSDGEAKRAAARELIALVSNLGGKVAAFSHSRDELRHVLHGAANFLERPDGRGTIVLEARKLGRTKSDLLLLAESIDDKLSEAGIEVEYTPRYIKDFQIDETAFEQVLKDEVSYYNPRAKEYDINSVRSIYVIRAKTPALTLEKARAVLVTSNAGFARAAWDYGKEYRSSQNVSSVITDFTLANMAWLKAPMGAPTVPTTQLLAVSYAALEPSGELLKKYLKEIDRLEGQGTISERDHQLLRSSPSVHSELMHLTLGEDAALTEETVTEALERVSNEIKKEESEKFAAEKEAHQRTQDALNSQRDRNQEALERVSNEIKKEESEKFATEKEAHQRTQDALNSQRDRNQEIMGRVYWRCYCRSRVMAWILSVVIGIMLLGGLSVPLGLGSTDPIFAWGIGIGSIIVALLTLTNLLFGSTVKGLHNWVENRCLTWLLKREAKTIGIDLNELIND